MLSIKLFSQEAKRVRRVDFRMDGLADVVDLLTPLRPGQAVQHMISEMPQRTREQN